jgi:hypothetical protein
VDSDERSDIRGLGAKVGSGSARGLPYLDVTYCHATLCHVDRPCFFNNVLLFYRKQAYRLLPSISEQIDTHPHTGIVMILSYFSGQKGAVTSTLFLIVRLLKQPINSHKGC